MSKPRGRLTGTGQSHPKDRGPVPMPDSYDLSIGLPPVMHHPEAGGRSRACSCGHWQFGRYGTTLPADTHRCPNTDPSHVVHWKRS